MSAIRSIGNRTEVALRSAVHRRGLRFRKYRGDLPGRPDFVFPKERVAVFVDGDFWHARLVREQGPESIYTRIKTATLPYWVEKLQRNVRRDDEVNEQLRALGWTVMRYWESEIKRNVDATAAHISKTVQTARKRLSRQAR
jgi:DNA mismatch endonuclease, patch repair protein